MNMFKMRISDVGQFKTVEKILLEAAILFLVGATVHGTTVLADEPRYHGYRGNRGHGYPRFCQKNDIGRFGMAIWELS